MILSKDKLPEWLAILQKYTFLAPTESNGVILFKRIKNPAEIVLDRRSVNSPKGIVLPQTETLFTFTTGHTKELNPQPRENGMSIIFGLRPCDAKSLSTLDLVFNGEYRDESYLKSRDDSVLIGLACRRPETNCFCTSFDYGPGSTEDVDILLTEMGDRYFVDVVTEKGQALVGECNALFTAATDADLHEKNEVTATSESLIKRSVDVDGLPEKLETVFECDLWKSISMKCLGCGVCTYLCPTCHCFDIQDEVHLRKGRRARIWDSCMYPEYTIHTSGHNPRPARMNRIRNRVYHKFKYYPDNFNAFLCVGCGRCVDLCPVNIDIIDIIARVRGEPHE